MAIRATPATAVTAKRTVFQFDGGTEIVVDKLDTADVVAISVVEEVLGSFSVDVDNVSVVVVAIVVSVVAAVVVSVVVVIGGSVDNCVDEVDSQVVVETSVICVVMDVERSMHSLSSRVSAGTA